MQAIGVLLLAAATAGDGFGYSSPGVGLKKWLRPHVEVTTDATGAPPYNAASLAGRSGGPGSGRRFTVTKSQIYFLDPDRMQIGWQTAAPNGERAYPPPQLVVPARYNFNQGYIYRLKMTSIPGRPNSTLYPSIEVAQTTPVTDAYLAHNAIPVQFTNEDFDQVIDGGNFVTKVIYLPDPKYQELAVSGVETLVSTRLEAGIDPILEADKRGTILLIVRLGAIDLEMPATVGAAGPGASIEMAPNTLPPGVAPATAPPGTVILDPTTPAQPTAPAQPTTPPAGATPTPAAPAPGPTTPPAPAPGGAPPVPKPATADAAEAAVPLTALAPMPEPPAVQAPAAVAPGGN
jgi:hypothetical protein